MTAPASYRTIPVAVALLWSGCATTPAPAPPTASAPEPPAVVLVLAGSAFPTPAARDEATHVVHEHTRRPARALAAEPPMERVIQTAGARMEKLLARAARAEARNPRCTKKGRALGTAVAERADTVLRVKLDAKTTARTATEAERQELAASGFGRVLSSVGLGEDTLYETKLEGTIERVTFPGAAAVAKRRIRWTGRRLGPKDTPPPPAVRDALAQALAAMPAAAPARFEPIARAMVSGGCPVLGAAIADTFLDGTPKRRIRAAAVAMLGPAPQAPPNGPVETVAAEPEVIPFEPEPAPAPAPETAYSCTTLCTLHMVELCNNDRTLWSQHGARWENTRCGVRRSESFLENCYRMQWLSGTYEQSCVAPCERGEDGRTRLLAMLRRSGCIRADG